MSAMPYRETGTFSSHVCSSRFCIRRSVGDQFWSPPTTDTRPHTQKRRSRMMTGATKNHKKKKKNTQGRVIRIPASGAAGTDVHSGSEMLPRACACTWFPPTYRPGMLLVPAVVPQPGRRPQGTAQGPCSNPRRRGSDLGIAQVHGPGWAAAGTVVIVILFSSG